MSSRTSRTSASMAVMISRSRALCSMAVNGRPSTTSRGSNIVGPPPGVFIPVERSRGDLTTLGSIGPKFRSAGHFPHGFDRLRSAEHEPTRRLVTPGIELHAGKEIEDGVNGGDRLETSEVDAEAGVRTPGEREVLCRPGPAHVAPIGSGEHGRVPVGAPPR